MNTMKSIFLKLFFVIIIIFLCYNTILGKNLDNKKEIIFLIDASNSMKSFDTQNLVSDEVKKMSNFLTLDYKVGIVVYNTQIVDYANVSNDLVYFNSILDRVKYTGYTNAGDALDYAINMFSKDASFKNIIMISDGEIALKNQDLTNQSTKKFKQAIELSREKNILIDIIALGELTQEGKKSNIFEATKLTGGEIFRCNSIFKLNEVSNKILFDKFGIKQSQIGVGNALNGEINVNLPVINLDKVKILLSSTDNISDINVNCKSESANVIVGKNFSIVEVINPYENIINLKYSSNGNVKAYLLQEYIVDINGEITNYRYEDNTVKATLNIFLKNKKGNILDNSYYNNKTAKLNINDKIYEGKIENNKIYVNLNVLDLKQDLEIILNLEEFEQNFLNLKQLNLKLDKTKINELLEANKNNNYLPLYIILILLLFLITIILIKVNNGEKEEPKRTSTIFKNPYEYFGKLNIYVLNTKDGCDIAPQVFNLQRNQNNDKITLKDILDACKLDIGDDSASKIVFEPSMNKALKLTNHSYSTIIKGGSLITFNKNININFNEKINIMLEDEVTEIEIHYKNLKPSEVKTYI
ncbi:vWA domain-containing protein [[Clostridium] colinum]|uniref:vWA domain-containing protein n=1 Tax=[Clostridium] colinum TaxID=36835 RepID=UPI0020240C6C|nr:vWA domain-containing protein [[Clostridium] colinum]